MTKFNFAVLICLFLNIGLAEAQNINPYGPLTNPYGPLTNPYSPQTEVYPIESYKAKDSWPQKAPPSNQLMPYSSSQQTPNIYYDPAQPSQKTGADFLTNLLIFGVVVVLPALVLSIIRANNTCDIDQEGGWIAGFIAFVISLAGIYIILVFINWDSKLYIDYLLGYPIAEAIGVATHVMLILLFSKFISVWLEPMSDSICLGYYGLLFGLSAFLIHDILKGKKSFIINWLS